MNIAVSPYHLTTREPPAMAAVLLASRVVTFMPGVFAGESGSREAVRLVAERSVRYARLMETWGWSMPLWRAGIVASSHAGDDAASDIRAAWDRLLSDDRYAAMRPFVKATLGEDAAALVDAVAGDVLKGGPDPAVSVPLLAGLDRFACRHGMAAARAEPTSIAQKAEAALAEPAARVVVPLILQGSAEAILHAREELGEELDELRAALATVAALAAERPRPDVRGAVSALMGAALAYERAFSRAWPVLEAGQDRDDIVLKAGPVSLGIAGLPADAVLQSSCAAARTLLGARPPARVAARRAAKGSVETLPVVADALDYGLVAALTIKPLGRPAAK